MDYGHIILTSGGRSGGYLVRLAERLNNSSVFVLNKLRIVIDVEWVNTLIFKYGVSGI